MPEGTLEGTNETTETHQDVKKAEGEEGPKGTNDLYGTIDFGDVSYTNEYLKKETSYDAAVQDGLVNKVTEWTWEDTASGKTFVYGAIPADAIVDAEKISIDGTPNADAIAYADATDAQLKAAKGTTDSTLWHKGNTYYIAAYYYGDTDNNRQYIPSYAKGTYYAESRTYTYKLWELKAEGDKYVTEHDAHSNEASAYTITVTISEQKDGTLKAEPKLVTENSTTPISTSDPIVFENKYEAKGKVVIGATKKIDGRDEFGRETFSGKHTFTFEIDRVTADAPLPATTTKTRSRCPATPPRLSPTAPTATSRLPTRPPAR